MAGGTDRFQLQANLLLRASEADTIAIGYPLQLLFAVRERMATHPTRKVDLAL